jgi:hypothetical protein
MQIVTGYNACPNRPIPSSIFATLAVANDNRSVDKSGSRAKNGN